jgi:hypothetical protein
LKHIYECLRIGELKKTSALIKEYFPVHASYTPVNSKDKQGEKQGLELKILKLRTQWNEFILSRTKRENFFRSQFHIQYDQEFLGYLLVKVTEIFDLISAHLPLTQIEEVTFFFLFYNLSLKLFDLNSKIRFKWRINFKFDSRS